jgi:hypothetical protein
MWIFEVAIKQFLRHQELYAWLAVAVNFVRGWQ